MTTAAVVGAVTGQLVQRLITLAIDEISPLWRFKADMEKLVHKLGMIQELLTAANHQPSTANSLTTWLSNLRGVAYDAEYILDELASESLRHKLELKNRMKIKANNFFSLSNPISFRLKMVCKVSKINRKLDELNKEANDFNLYPSPAPAGYAENYIPTGPFPDDKIVVGRDADVMKVVDMLVSFNNKEDLPVVAVVGMAGLGKSTVAQLAYSHEAVRKCFRKQIWVCVSVNFNAERLLNEMIQSLCGVSLNLSNTEAAVMKLREALEGKNYLLVLDDVWIKDPGTWESARNALLGIKASCQSKILVTARSSEVARTIQAPPFVHKLEGLSNNDSWSLFRKKAFVVGGADENATMETIEKKIVEKCRGVQLAINAVAAVARSKKTEHEWLAVQNSRLWSLPEGRSRVFPALMLSFHYLPSSSLKQCFVYCSIFPKDFVMDRANLIQLWMAQGFLQPPKERNSEMEDIGSEYFDTLLWNSFLQDTKVDRVGNIVSCKMHDLVHDLAKFISGSEVVVIDEDHQQGGGLSEVRHLSSMANGGCREETPHSGYSRKLRSLFTGRNAESNMLLKLISLRCLSLSRSTIKELPVSIHRLKHLRYLDISSTQIEVLPSSVSRLYNLQTLRMENCSSLKELPREFCNLINLRHLHLDHQVQLPNGIGHLRDLQTLSHFAVFQDKCSGIEELGPLKKLRGKLLICNLENIRDEEEAKRACLGEKSLHELVLKWGSDQEGVSSNSEVVLEGLQPHPWLKSLTVDGFKGGKFPTWLSELEKLVEIRLEDCKNCVHLPTLGHLPFLRFLNVDGLVKVTCIGSEFYDTAGGVGSSLRVGNDSRRVFPALRTLQLRNMLELLKWSDTPANFPRLENLAIMNCPKLSKAPSHFPCLKKLHIESISSVGLASICSSNELKNLTSFKMLRVSGMSSLPDGLLQNNKNLTSVFINGCDELVNVWPLDDHHFCCTSLQLLQISNCLELTYIADKFQTLSSLKTLVIRSCHNLRSLPDLDAVSSLWHLSIEGCNKLTSLPSGLQSCTSLKSLTIGKCSNEMMLSLPVEEFKYLDHLHLEYCGEVTCLPEGLQYLTQLKGLGIGGFDSKLDGFPSLRSISRVLPSLESLTLIGWPKLKNLPLEMQQLAAIRVLIMLRFDGVEALPECLGNFKSLIALNIHSWEKLKCLPESLSRLSKLQHLSIGKCPQLMERCTKHTGSDWWKISHIPTIYIENNWIQYQGNRKPSLGPFFDPL